MEATDEAVEGGAGRPFKAGDVVAADVVSLCVRAALSCSRERYSAGWALSATATFFSASNRCCLGYLAPSQSSKKSLYSITHSSNLRSISEPMTQF